MSGGVEKVIKRDGSVQDFDRNKISRAISKAFSATGEKDGKIAEKISIKVQKEIDKNFSGDCPRVENIQDIVEEALIQEGFSKVAKAYILYRQKRSDIRDTKVLLGVYDDLKLSINAVNVLQRRYLLKDAGGQIIETPKGMFMRVAKAIAMAELVYNPKADIEKLEDRFFDAMASMEFLPNSPTLMNAGTGLGQLSACFVLPVNDSLRGIFDSLKLMALIQQSGGGTGFSFSRLRPKGDDVKSTHGVASGPISFMKIFNKTTDIIKQGGKRRGANMGILNVDHPDIIDFITAKESENEFRNFNLSVAVTDDFLYAVEKDRDFDLMNPRTKKTARTVKARDLFDLMVASAWKTGDPGLIFIDEINRKNPIRSQGDIESTNPCGEVPLLPYESCNLGSINLALMVKEGKGQKEIDWDRLKRTVRTGVHFLDNVIDANVYPSQKLKKMALKNRKIGLGVMGFAEMIIQLGIPYDSEEAVALARKVMKFISREGHRKSRELATDRGEFPAFRGSIWDIDGKSPMRNATVTTIAPTGTISIIANTSSGIEPLFAISFMRNVMDGTELLETNSIFRETAKKSGFYSPQLMARIARQGTVQGIEEIPEEIKKLFVTALDIHPQRHVKIQAAFQEFTDNAVSKTVNLPANATLDDVKDIFLLAHWLKCKGVTVYRYGSKTKQVLYMGSKLDKSSREDHIRADSEFSGGCPRDCIV